MIESCLFHQNSCILKLEQNKQLLNCPGFCLSNEKSSCLSVILELCPYIDNMWSCLSSWFIGHYYYGVLYVDLSLQINIYTAFSVFRLIGSIAFSSFEIKDRIHRVQGSGLLILASSFLSIWLIFTSWFYWQLLLAVSLICSCRRSNNISGSIALALALCNRFA